jgi:hypothetical protein
MFGPLPASAITLGSLCRHPCLLPWARLVRSLYELVRGGLIIGRHLAGLIEKNWVHAHAMASLGWMLSTDGNGITPLVEGDVT